MFDRIREAYATYLHRIEFQVLIVLMFTLLTFRNGIVQTLSHLGISYLTIAVLFVVIYSAVLGEHLKRQFASHRTHLIPNYRASHLWTALGLSLIFGALVCMPLAQTSPDGFKGIEGLIVFLWSMALLAFCTGYFLRPLFIFMFLSLGFITEPIKASSILLAVLAKRNPELSLVLVFNSVASILLVWRMTHLHEEMLEYRWMQAMDNPRFRFAQDPTRGSLLRRFYDWLCQPSQGRINRVRRPLQDGRLSYMRHFQLGLGMGQPILPSILLWTGVMWFVDFITGLDARAAWTSMVMFLPAFTLISSSGGFQKSTLQWVGMLPMTRKELVITFGGAMFWSVLKWWFCYAVAVYFVAWMSLPGSIRDVPPLLPLATSFSIQFPLFGVATLSAMSQNALNRTLAFVAVVAGFAFFSTLAQTAPQTALVIAAAVISGAALIWVSYRYWCKADID